MRNLLIITWLCFILLSCSKNEDEINIDTDNFMICYVNGEKHTYSGKPVYFKPDGVVYYKMGSPKSVYISGDDSKYNDRIMIEVYTHDIELNKRYEISNDSRKDYAIYAYNTTSRYAAKNNTGHIIYSCFTDTAITGFFAFTGYTEDSQKIEITNGYFNIQRPK